MHCLDSQRVLSCYAINIAELIFRCKTSVFQKESFWVAKGVLLLFKRSPFTVQKGSFYNAKRVLLENMGNQGAV